MIVFFHSPLWLSAFVLLAFALVFAATVALCLRNSRCPLYKMRMRKREQREVRQEFDLESKMFAPSGQFYLNETAGKVI